MNFNCKLKRIHLFEFSDQKWLPKIFRNYLTDILEYHLTIDKTYEVVAPLLINVSKKTGFTQIVDLCSGSGGGWRGLSSLLLKDGMIEKIILTDKYPKQRIVFDKNIRYENKAVDVLNIPKRLKGIRTLFSSFHHFSKKNAKKILLQAVNEQQPICVFEFTQRKLSNIIGMIFSPIVVFLCTPFIKPFSFWRIFWTYIIPVLPLIYWWDGTVSHIRTYSIKELEEIIEEVDIYKQYKWDIGKKDDITYMIGESKLMAGDGFLTENCY